MSVDAAELAAASVMPAAHQRRAMFPFCQFFTLAEWVRAIEIIDSMLLVERSVRASVGHAFKQAAGRAGMGAVQLLGQCFELRLAFERRVGVVGLAHPLGDRRGQVIRQLVCDVADLVQLAALNHRVVEDPHDGRPQRLAAVDAHEGCVGPSLAGRATGRPRRPPFPGSSGHR